MDNEQTQNGKINAINEKSNREIKNLLKKIQEKEYVQTGDPNRTLIVGIHPEIDEFVYTPDTEFLRATYVPDKY